jgi:hypothetical protein
VPEKQAKTPTEWRALFLKDWPSRLVLTAVTAFCGYAWAQGEDVVKRKIMETVKPSIDSLAKKQENTDEKLDALIDVMGRAFPEFKKAAKERAEERRDSKEVQDALTGDAQ